MAFSGPRTLHSSVAFVEFFSIYIFFIYLEMYAISSLGDNAFMLWLNFLITNISFLLFCVWVKSVHGSYLALILQSIWHLTHFQPVFFCYSVMLCIPGPI